MPRILKYKNESKRYERKRKENLKTFADFIFFHFLTLSTFQSFLLQLEIAFRQFDSEGNRLRQGSSQIATALNLNEPRADRLLKAAMRAVPLPADHDPIEVVFEDDDFIALNKPYGIITAPKHRYVGGSMVNRIIGNRGLEPAVLHRLDMNTTGVVLFAKTRDIVPAVHLQFREKTARKQYIALVAGVPKWETCVVDAPIGNSPVEK